MAIPTYNTRQTDSGSNPAAYNPFPAYKPWNPFAKQQQQQQQPAIRNRGGANWTYNASGMPVYQAQPQQPVRTVPGANWIYNAAGLPVVQTPQQMMNRQVLAQGPIRPTALQSQQAQRAAAQMQVDIRQRQFLNDLRAGKFATPYEEWQASGGVNRQLTDWFDPYDPAGSPYMTSQYVPQTNYDYGGGGGYGYGGGWGGYGGGGYEHQDSASFYQGNYTQRRNRWNETLLTWGLRQE